MLQLINASASRTILLYFPAKTMKWLYILPNFTCASDPMIEWIFCPSRTERFLESELANASASLIAPSHSDNIFSKSASSWLVRA